MKPSKLLQSFLLAAGSSLLAVTSASAQLTTYSWVGTSSNWATAGNWVVASGPLGTPPPTGGTIDARINVGAAGNLNPGLLEYTSAQGTTIFAPTSNRALVIASNNAASTTATVTISGGIFDSRGSQDIISNGNAGNSGTLNITGGTYTNVNAALEEGRALVVGFSGGTANLNISSGSAITGRIKFLIDGGTTNLNTTGNVALSGTGILETGGFTRGTRTATEGATLNFNTSFDGGTLRAREDNADFMTSAVVNGNALVRAGGVAIDTNGFNIGISKALTQDVGSPGGGLTKTGAGTLTLSASNSYSGATTVSAGTLYVTGALSSTVTVEANGTIGRNTALNGGLGNNGLTIAAGGNLDLTGATLGTNSTGILEMTGGTLTLGSLTFADLIGWTAADAEVGTYKLIDGSFTVDFGSTVFLSPETAFDFGNGKKGYFTSGSLNAVIIPEPSAALLGGLGLLALLRRRR